VRLGRSYAVSDQGRRRLRNEDAYLCDPPLFAVVDGMGGAQAGELASRLAADALGKGARGSGGAQAVVDLVQEANRSVYRRALEDTSAAGMGTTATVALFDEERGVVAIGHVGDSRAYLVRGGELEQLTADHSLVGELVRSGRLTQEEAEVHPQRFVITRALGTEADVDVDTIEVEASDGDLFLICSDGLSNMLPDADILKVVEGGDSNPRRVAEALVAAANRAGGEDNVTVVAFETVAQAAEPDMPTAEHAVPEELEGEPEGPPADEPVVRHGAGKGGRALAILAVVLMLAVAGLLLWLGVAR
jgi:PPM family protein phosphatase